MGRQARGQVSHDDPDVEALSSDVELACNQPVSCLGCPGWKRRSGHNRGLSRLTVFFFLNLF